MARVVLEGGIVAYRRELRRRGGLRAASIAAVVGGIGAILVVLPGRLTGVVGFALLIAAFPLLVAFGVPLASGLSTIGIGVVASLAVWWGVGTLAAWLATNKPIADWRDWTKQVLPFALALVLGAFLGLGVFALGVL